MRDKVKPTGDLTPIYVPEAFDGYVLLLYVCGESQSGGPCEGNLRASMMITRITDEMFPVYGNVLALIIAPGAQELGFADDEIAKLRKLTETT